MTYTQVVSNSDQTPIQPNRQGFNRDSLLVTPLYPGWTLGVVADGVSLRYWSEVAAKIACKEFTTYMCHFLSCHVRKDVTVEVLRDAMSNAILHVNQCLVRYFLSRACTRMFVVSSYSFDLSQDLLPSLPFSIHTKSLSTCLY
eukprot:TRINITY_DN12146_c0_g1_i3.p1 TRINITY_DN12146_c0_g1~~TRINITY_DN12146_c0_g1_i3.p1  ORF type:complete len:165 (+),score=22.65 TRINITY_DN12146_c0_g1_i3:67-495(+)